MSILMKMNRNRIIRGIARNCTPYLATGYGSQSAYSQGQIDRALEETGCNSNYSDYAYVMFGKEEDFPDTSSESYAELSSEIGEIFFDGNNDFGAQDFMSYSSNTESQSGDGCADGGDGD
jgi:hypothetical protein